MMASGTSRVEKLSQTQICTLTARLLLDLPNVFLLTDLRTYRLIREPCCNYQRKGSLFIPHIIPDAHMYILRPRHFSPVSSVGNGGEPKKSCTCSTWKLQKIIGPNTVSFWKTTLSIESKKKTRRSTFSHVCGPSIFRTIHNILYK